jgi:hypothetical protein
MQSIAGDICSRWIGVRRSHVIADHADKAVSVFERMIATAMQTMQCKPVRMRRTESHFAIAVAICISSVASRQL